MSFRHCMPSPVPVNRASRTSSRASSACPSWSSAPLSARMMPLVIINVTRIGGALSAMRSDRCRKLLLASVVHADAVLRIAFKLLRSLRRSVVTRNATNTMTNSIVSVLPSQ